jgi:hypothetical protein
MKKNLKKIVCVALLLFVPLQNIVAEIPEDFDPNTTDTVPISDGIPLLVLIAITVAFILYKKKKRVY